jgi:hypothetical protein
MAWNITQMRLQHRIPNMRSVGHSSTTPTRRAAAKSHRSINLILYARADSIYARKTPVMPGVRGLDQINATIVTLPCGSIVQLDLAG